VDALTFEFTTLKSGQSVKVTLQKPSPHDTMRCWVCKVYIRPDKLDHREFFGATSFQALEAAVSVVPTLLRTLYPNETLEESGYPFFPAPFVVEDDFSRDG